MANGEHWSLEFELGHESEHLRNRCLRCLNMALSKKAKARIKLMSATDAKAIKKAAKVLHSELLLGDKRANEIIRFVERHHRC